MPLSIWQLTLCARESRRQLCLVSTTALAKGSGKARLHWERYRRSNYEVGGVVEESHGWSWNRDVWILSASHTWVLDDSRLNEIRAHLGSAAGSSRSTRQRWASGLPTARLARREATGCDTDGGMDASFYGIGGTHHWQVGDGSHSLKAGVSLQHLKDRYEEDRFQAGLMLYRFDSSEDPFVYFHGVGSGVARLTTDMYGLFVQDEWRVRENLTLSVGLRYDLDTNGNLPDLEHPLTPDGRTGRRRQHPATPRLQLDRWEQPEDRRTRRCWSVRRPVQPLRTVHGRHVQQRIGPHALSEGEFLRPWALDPADPKNTGVSLPPNTALWRTSIRRRSNPGAAGTEPAAGLEPPVLDVEGVDSRGKNEPLQPEYQLGRQRLGGPWHAPSLVNGVQRCRYLHEGRPLPVQGTLAGFEGNAEGGSPHYSGVRRLATRRTTSTIQGRRGEPSDPADVEGEWGRSGTDERYRLVLSGVFKLPWDLHLATIYEYGSGRPWDRVYGYDFNGDLSSRIAPKASRGTKWTAPASASSI